LRLGLIKQGMSVQDVEKNISLIDAYTIAGATFDRPSEWTEDTLKDHYSKLAQPTKESTHG